MNKQDVERLAREAGFSFNSDHGDYPLDSTAIVGGIENALTLAALVLEEAAKVAESAATEDPPSNEAACIAAQLRAIAEGLKP